MAINAITNQVPSNGADIMYRLKNLLSSSNWTVVSTSNGTTAVDGDSWTSPSVVANNYAWMLLRSSDNTRWFTYQRGTNNHDWRAKYLSGSYNADGTGTTTPTAVAGTLPEYTFEGGGSDASPSFTSNRLYQDGQVRIHAVASTSPQWWWFGAFEVGTGTPRAMWGLDTLVGANAEDPDPVAVIRTPYANGWDSSNYVLSSRDHSPAVGIYSGSYGCTWQILPGLKYSTQQNEMHGYMGNNSITGKVDAFPVLFARGNNDGFPTGYKGTSTIFKWVPRIGLGKGTILNLTGDKSHIILTAAGSYVYCVPWDGASNFNL